jgi:hypothetical protein
MSAGLAVYLSTGNDGLFALVIAGSVLATLGMVLFVCQVLVDIRRRNQAARAPQAQSG